MAADRRAVFTTLGEAPTPKPSSSPGKRLAPSEITRLTAAALRQALARGKLSPRDVAEAFRTRITMREPQVAAFAHIDWNQVDKQIKTLRTQPSGSGPLWGVPIAIKDLFDTCDLPTAYGSDIYAGHRPAWDAAAISRLRAAGAVILGKTVTTEFAWRKSAKTRNPHDGRFSPGGSSSGSAAAVADRMTPVAIGSQTAGSVIRPAAFCGVIGFKPTYGIISVAGIKLLAQSVDGVGVFSRTVEDSAIVASIMANRPDWAEATAVKKAPKMALVRSAEWDLVSQPAMNVFMKAAERLGGRSIAKRKVPKSFAELAATHSKIVSYEAARELQHEQRAHPERLSPILRGLLEDGAGIAPSQYMDAVAERDHCIAHIDQLFGDADILLAPSALGEAPRLEEGTGDPVMSRAWTLLRLPTITLPVGRGPNGLPLGLQMAARPGQDARLLSVALWAEDKLGTAQEAGTA
jgi:Asp-tRNA(Asn)/Glu-tRNA(Gln) amidotransferase A subunit family amidase